MDCIFCAIAGGGMQTEILAENESVVAFRDIRPQAPVHILLVPKQHTKDVTQLTDGKVLAELFELVREVSSVHTSGSFRLQFNTGAASGQTVFHTHAHLLAKD